jgi:hypothetical protein
MTTLQYPLDVRLVGTVDQNRLTILRDRLGLDRQGRLGDAEDSIFGDRTIKDGDVTLELDLVRWADGTWQVLVSHRTAPPSQELIHQLETQIRTAAADAELRVDRVIYP